LPPLLSIIIEKKLLKVIQPENPKLLLTKRRNLNRLHTSIYGSLIVQNMASYKIDMSPTRVSKKSTQQMH